MDSNPLLKRLMKESKDDVVHSSAYAKAQNAGGIGAASVESFAARQAMEAKRAMVGRYKDSNVVTGNTTTSRATRYDAVKDADRRKLIKEKFNNRPAEDRQGGATTNGDRFAAKAGPGVPPVRRNPGISR